jgi:hypothetical protein
MSSSSLPSRLIGARVEFSFGSKGIEPETELEVIVSLAGISHRPPSSAHSIFFFPLLHIISALWCRIKVEGEEQ